MYEEKNLVFSSNKRCLERVFFPAINPTLHRLVIQIITPTELKPYLFATLEKNVERNLKGFTEIYSLANYNLT